MSATKDPILTIVLSFYGLLIFIVVCVLALVFGSSTMLGQATCPPDKMKDCVTFNINTGGEGAWYDPEYTAQGGSILHDANPNEGVEPTYERVYLTEDVPHCKPGHHLMQYVNGVDLETNTQPHYQFDTYSHFVYATAPNPNTRLPGYRCIADAPKSEGAKHPQPQDVDGTFEGSPLDGMFVGSSQPDPCSGGCKHLGSEDTYIGTWAPDTFPPSSTVHGYDLLSYSVTDYHGKMLIKCDSNNKQEPYHCVLQPGVTLDELMRNYFKIADLEAKNYTRDMGVCIDRNSALENILVHLTTQKTKKAGAH